MSPGTPAPEFARTLLREIHFDIVEKPRDGAWHIIGSAPQEVTGEGGLWVTRANRGSGFDVRNSLTDEILSSGRSIRQALANLAKVTGIKVILVDETAGDRILGTWG